jgi:hypothetical protein
MKKLLILILAIISITAIDIALWQRIFEANELWEFIGSNPGQYHYGYFIAMWGLLSIGVAGLLPAGRDAVWFAVSFRLALMMGVEDLLYYWLDGRPLPTILPWLDEHPLIFFSPVTDASLLFNVFLWVMLTISFHYMLKRSHK